MDRTEAISRIAAARLPSISVEDRYFYLTEGANETGWQNLSEDQKAQISQDRIADAGDPCWNEIVLVRMSAELDQYTNRYLTELLARAAGVKEEVRGEYKALPEICPCCGAKSLTEKAAWDICRVCWWEDDGQDDHNADLVAGGPNGPQSLTSARANYLRHGIFDPARDDLRKHQEPRYAYAEGRRFEFAEDGAKIVEIALPRG